MMDAMITCIMTSFVFFCGGNYFFPDTKVLKIVYYKIMKHNNISKMVYFECV